MPHESEIRPEPILRKCLGHVRQMREEGKAEGAVLEQFRSIRQVWSLSAFRGPKERVYSQKTGLDGSGHPERVLPRGLRGQHAVLFGSYFFLSISISFGFFLLMFLFNRFADFLKFKESFFKSL